MRSRARGASNRRRIHHEPRHRVHGTPDGAALLAADDPAHPTVFTPLARPTVFTPSIPLTVCVIASVFCASVSALPSRDGSLAAKEDPIKSRTIRRHRPWLERAPNQALVSTPLPLLHHADLPTKYAETRPEPSSCTGRRCGEQRRTWKQEQN